MNWDAMNRARVLVTRERQRILISAFPCWCEQQPLRFYFSEGPWICCFRKVKWKKNCTAIFKYYSINKKSLEAFILKTQKCFPWKGGIPPYFFIGLHVNSRVLLLLSNRSRWLTLKRRIRRTETFLWMQSVRICFTDVISVRNWVIYLPLSALPFIKDIMQ